VGAADARPSNVAAAPDPRIDAAPASAARRVNDGCPTVFAFTVTRPSHRDL